MTDDAPLVIHAPVSAEPGEQRTLCGAEGFVAMSPEAISCDACEPLRPAAIQPLPREYSAAEAAAFRTLSPVQWGQTYADGRGPAWYATGPHWPKELRAQAEHWDRLAAAARTAADAMEREGCV